MRSLLREVGRGTSTWPGRGALVAPFRHLHTGVLLGTVPARPFWNTPMVAQLFLFSALSSGPALVMLVAPRLGGRGRPEDARLVLSVDVLFILLELFIVIPFILHGELSTLAARTSLGLILGGPLTGTFWWV